MWLSIKSINFAVKMETYRNIYLVLAAMLLLCLAPMPYGYYTLVRFASAVIFCVMAYRFYEQKREGLMWTAGALAVLFQPFLKLALGRTVWNIVDVIVAVGLVVLWWRERQWEK